MVIGDRLSSTYFTENKRRFHNTGNKTVKKLVNRLFKGNIEDIMTGYRAFSPLFVKTFPVLSQGFEIETEMTIHALHKNLNLATVLIDYRDRPEGSFSKLNTISDGSRVLTTIAMLYKNYKPLQFFGIVSIICLIAAILFVLPGLVGYVQTGEVTRGIMLLIGGFVFIASILFLICGLILNTVVGQDRQAFEVKLNLLDLMLKQRKESSKDI